MKQIRHSVFETNSSSSHSITLLNLLNDFDSSDEQQTEHTNYIITERTITDYEVWVGNSYGDHSEGVYYVCGGEFGWEWFMLNSFDAKMDYVYTLFKECQEYEKYGYCADLIGKVKEKYPDYKKTLTDIIKRYYNGEIVDVVFEEETDCFIDHSDDYVDMILFNDEWSLEEILTNDDIVILGGNDNDY